MTTAPSSRSSTTDVPSNSEWIIASRSPGFTIGAVALALALALGTPGAGRSAHAAGDADQVPMPIQVAILVKVLAYDHALAPRAKEGLTVGVVFTPKSDESREAKDAFVRAFKEAPRLVAGKAVNLIEVPEDLIGAEAKKGVDVLYLCDGIDVASAITLAKEHDLVSFAADRTAVESGVVLGLVPRNGKPKLLINVAASLDAGMRLDPQILGLAELVR